MRERHNLERNEVGKLVAKLKQRTKGRELGIGHIHVGAHVLHTEARLVTRDAAHASFDILNAQSLLPLAPALDPLKKRAAHIPLRLARRENRVEVNVALHKRREREAPLGVPCLFARLGGEMGFNVGKATVGNAQVNRALPAR